MILRDRVEETFELKGHGERSRRFLEFGDGYF